MLVVYGTLDREQVVAGEIARCRRCHSEALQEVVRHYRVVVLWLPIWSYGDHHRLRCGHCLAETAASAPEGPLVAKPFLDRFGGLVLAFLLAAPATLAVVAVYQSVQADMAAAEEIQAPTIPIGDRVLAALEGELVVGEGTGLDARAARMAAAVHAALALRPDVEGEGLGVSAARVTPRSGERRVVFLVRGALPRHREGLREVVHTANSALGDHHDGEMLVFAFGTDGGYHAIARGHHHDPWQLQTDPRLVRERLLQALTY